ncbi:MAG: DUF4189 domain-containing protein [Cohaesibacter sp.]|jgi:hypothetical protein|nr:DUF4189 domain-containing protein [Cohaesibacter sp.]
MGLYNSTILSGLVIAGLALSANSAQAGYLWGAVALSQDIGAYGISSNMGDRASARRMALRLCRNQGASNCRIKADFRGCASIATDPNAIAYGIGLANSPAQAQRNAIRQCNRYAGGGCYSAGVRCND